MNRRNYSVMALVILLTSGILLAVNFSKVPLIARADIRPANVISEAPKPPSTPTPFASPPWPATFAPPMAARTTAAVNASSQPANPQRSVRNRRRRPPAPRSN